MSAVEQWGVYWANVDAADAADVARAWRRTAETWQAKARALEAELAELKGINAGNLAEKVVLRSQLLKHSRGQSPLIADMLKNPNPTHVARATFMRDKIHTDAERVLRTTKSWDAVKEYASRVTVD